MELLIFTQQNDLLGCQPDQSSENDFCRAYLWQNSQKVKATSQMNLCACVKSCLHSSNIGTHQLQTFKIKKKKKKKLAAVSYLGFSWGLLVSYVFPDFLLSSSRFNTSKKQPAESCPGQRRVCASVLSGCRRMNGDEASPSVTAGRSRV